MTWDSAPLTYGRRASRTLTDVFDIYLRDRRRNGSNSILKYSQKTRLGAAKKAIFAFPTSLMIYIETVVVRIGTEGTICRDWGGTPGGNGDRGPFGANNSKDTRSTPPEI